MVKSHCLRLVLMALGACLLVSGGCARTGASRFYTLSPLPVSEAKSGPQATNKGIAIGVGPIKLPEHLDRSQIVTRTSSNELELAEFDRWAGSLADDFSRVLAENLSILLSTDRVSIYPWRKSIPVQYQIVIDVIRFDGELGKSASLITRWTVFGGRTKKVLFMQKSRINEASGAPTYKAMVAAQSRALAQLSREIADAIENISQKPADQ